MPEETPAQTVATAPPRAAARGGRRAVRVRARRIAGLLLVASVGIALSGVVARRSAPEEDAPMPPVARPMQPDVEAGAKLVPPGGPATPSRQGGGGAVVRHGEDDDQPAGACWLAVVDGASSCMCSAGTIETLLTPDYMRALLAAWRDGGSLTTTELHARLREVDAACGQGEAAR